mmetsp:Transcript_34013/g.76836  ORF Transcript_34013/g.76836 Transcript_34013/m.76836 type:complete len:210 (-) Transcript_34013:85-714(-)
MASLGSGLLPSGLPHHALEPPLLLLEPGLVLGEPRGLLQDDPFPRGVLPGLLRFQLCGEPWVEVVRVHCRVRRNSQVHPESSLVALRLLGQGEVHPESSQVRRNSPQLAPDLTETTLQHATLRPQSLEQLIVVPHGVAKLAAEDFLAGAQGAVLVSILQRLVFDFGRQDCEVLGCCEVALFVFLVGVPRLLVSWGVVDDRLGKSRPDLA